MTGAKQVSIAAFRNDPKMNPCPADAGVRKGLVDPKFTFSILVFHVYTPKPKNGFSVDN